jgi:hypothetical protein
LRRRMMRVIGWIVYNYEKSGPSYNLIGLYLYAWWWDGWVNDLVTVYEMVLLVML